MKALLIFFLLAAPLSAQDAPPPAAEGQASAEMPAAMAQAKFAIQSGGLSKVYDTNLGALFLNKTFLTQRMSDGSQRTFAYKKGELQGNTYMLPVEMRSGERLYTLFKFYFTHGGGPEAYLTHWEEINFISRYVLRYTSYAELAKGVDFFQSLQPKPKKTPPPLEEASE